jgi:2-oxoglutarate dehydrogenase E2 component (dihydrolipoamide succinyltransferase)
MADFEIVMPKMGESIIEATITKWLKNVGDVVTEDEAIVEIATDKVDSEIPSPISGTIKKLLYQEGDVVAINEVVAIIETDNKIDTKKPSPSTGEKISPEKPDDVVFTQRETPLIFSATTEGKLNKDSGSRFYSPLVRNIAKEEGVTFKELETIEGSGKDNRVTKDDILKYIENRKKGSSEPGKSGTDDKKKPQSGQPKSGVIEPKTEKGDEVIEMTRMRKLIVEHMVTSKDTSVHVTSVIEIDVTNLVNWREKNKIHFQKREGDKLTFTPVFIWAVAKTLKDYPLLNSSVGQDKIILRKSINIGMATALPDGNLIVPVIKNADHKSLLGLVKSVNDLANRARNNKLQPDEIQGGTFTLTNVGTFDTIFATPIINQPQVAILAAGAIKKKPLVVETEHGDTIGIRSMMYLSMSYDHRIIDGALGGMALKRIGEYLQNWDVNQEI